MRARLRGVTLDPEPATLPADPADFAFNARLLVGPSDGEGEESFDVTVASPEWIAARCREQDGILHCRHHVAVDFDTFDRRRLLQWLEHHVHSVDANSWPEIGTALSRLGHWEFDDYRE
jgi:hypothetical protein